MPRNSNTHQRCADASTRRQSGSFMRMLGLWQERAAAGDGVLWSGLSAPSGAVV